MDKSTLSQYGWVIICIIIIAILLGLATPFGYFVKESVLNTVHSFGDTIVGKLPTPNPDTDDDGGDDEENNSITWFYGFYYPEEEDLGYVTAQIVSFSKQNSITREEASIYFLTEGTTTDKAAAEAMFAEKGMTLDDVCSEVGMSYNEFIAYINNYDDSSFAAYEELFLTIDDASKEMSITREEAFVYLITNGATTDRETAEAMLDGSGMTLDEYLLSELGVTYDEFVAALNKFDPATSSANFDTWVDNAKKIVFEKELPSNSVFTIDISKPNKNTPENKLVAYYTEGDVLHIAADGPVYAAPSMYCVFRDMVNLEEVDFNNSFNTSKVTDMSYMFSYSTNLRKINLSGFDTSNVTNMNNMFAYCGELESVNTSELNTSNVIEMREMFSGCSSLKSLDLSSFDTSKVNTMNAMFAHCGDSITLNLESFDFKNAKSVDRMFHFSGAEEIIFKNFNMSKATNFEYMFADCYNLKTIKFGNCNTSAATNMSYMFSCTPNLVELDLSDFDTSNVTTMTRMFNTGHNVAELGSPVYVSNLKKLNVSSFDTSKVRDMSGMFATCLSLENLDLSNFDFSQVTNMGSMFERCESLKTIKLSNFNAPNVTDTSLMFCRCTALENLDTSKFNMQNVTEAESMFQECASLSVVDLSSFNLGQTCEVSLMFAYMPKLETLKLPNSFKNGFVSSKGATHGTHNCEIYYNGDRDEISFDVQTTLNGPSAGNKPIRIIDGQFLHCNDGDITVSNIDYNETDDSYYVKN